MSETVSYCPLLGGPLIGGGEWKLGVYILCICLHDEGSALRNGRTKPEKAENLRLKSEKLSATQSGLSLLVCYPGKSG